MRHANELKEVNRKYRVTIQDKKMCEQEPLVITDSSWYADMTSLKTIIE